MQRFWAYLDKTPAFYLLVPLFLLVAPWPAGPEPHLVEKMRMLSEGQLTKPIDIFDVVWHGWTVPVIAAWFGRRIYQMMGRKP